MSIGLGSFVEGMKSGIGLRRDQERFDIAKEDRLRRIGQEDEDRAFELDQRKRALDKQKKADEAQSQRKDVTSEARQRFDEKVASGEMTDDDFATFWNDYTIPKLRNIMLEQQDYDGAKALDQWAASDDAQRGAKLVNSSLLKAQTGDHEGALKDVIEVSKINGYLDSEYEITGFEAMENGAGQVLGYRLNIQSGDEVVEQDIALSDIPQVISTFANPAAAFQSQLEARAAEGQRKQEMKDFATKEAIKANAKAGGNNAKQRADAIKSILDERENSFDAEEMPSFYDLAKDDQERMINERISVMTGEEPMVVPRAQVIADEQLGEVVPVGVARPERPDDVLPIRNDEEVVDPDNPLDLPVPWQKR